jgi:tetratricopeptide (TPR) repeat protein
MSSEATAAPSWDVFISYASADLAIAEDLYQRLCDAGFRVWFDKRELDWGDHWHEKIEQGCENSRIMLPVITPRWPESLWTRYETYGHDCVIPIWFESARYEDTAPPPLRVPQAADFRDPDVRDWSRLITWIRGCLAEASPEKAPRLVRLPFARNPYFVGREKLLLEVHEKLCCAPTVALTMTPAYVLAGLGGVGKTTLAREYAEKFWRLYRQILWVSAAEVGALPGEFARLALDMGVIGEYSEDVRQDAQRALAELSRVDDQATPRLLILDNATDEEAIQDWIPKHGKCRTIITSRFTDWSPEVQTIPVHVLEPKPAREFLLQRSGLPDTDENRTAADHLAAELGYLPLALEQAAAFVKQAQVSFGRYLELYAQSRQELLARGVPGGTRYPDSVATTWLTTIKRLGPEAIAILRLAAFLAPDNIPRDMLQGARSILEMTDMEIENALAELAGYSMIILAQDAFSVHRLVQAVQRDSLGEAGQRLWAERAVNAVGAAFPGVEFADWTRCKRLLPHALACAKHIGCWSIESVAAGSLLNRAGGYAYGRGDYADAERLCTQALEVVHRVLGEDHAHFATCLRGLALVYETQGNYEAAEPLIERALGIHRETLGDDHPDFARSLHCLARLRKAQGNYDVAESLYTQAMEIFRKTLGEEHSEFASCLNNLARLCEERGSFAAAELLYRQAMEIDRKTLGDNHPSYAASLNNLAALYWAQGNYDAAKPLLEQALEIRRRALGNGHPDYAQSLNNLAALQHARGDHDAAKPLYAQALEIRRRALGETHRDYATSLNNLAELYRAQGDYAAAEPLYRQALEIDRKALGRNHPDYATDLYNLSTLHCTQGKLADAESLLRQALEIRRSAFGTEHPNTRAALRNLAKLLMAMGKLDDVKALMREWGPELAASEPQAEEKKSKPKRQKPG